MPDKKIVDVWNSTIQMINDTRNNYIHFEPVYRTNFVSKRFDLGLSCLDIIEHILFHCTINLGDLSPRVSALFLYHTDIDYFKNSIHEIKELTKSMQDIEPTQLQNNNEKD